MLYLRHIPVDLKKYLPKFIVKEKTLGKILDSTSKEHEKERLLLDDITNQFFIKSATWSIKQWEKILAIIPTTDDVDARRNKILDHLQVKQTSTKDFFKKLIQRYLTSGKGYIIEDNKDYAFRIVLDGAFLLNKKELKEAIELFKPAHLGYKFRHLCLENLLPIMIKHHAHNHLLITGRGNFWNLGTFTAAIWDGMYLFNSETIWDGIKLDRLYKTTQTHKTNFTLNLLAQAKVRVDIKNKNKLSIKSKKEESIIHKSLKTNWHIQGKIRIFDGKKQKNKVYLQAELYAKQESKYTKATFFDGAFVFNGTHDFSTEKLAYPRHSLVIM